MADTKRLTLDVVLGACALIGILLTAGAVGGSFDERVTSLEDAQRKLGDLPEALASLKAEIKAMHQDVDRIDARQERVLEVVADLNHRSARQEKK